MSQVRLRSDMSLFRSRLSSLMATDKFCDLELVLVDGDDHVQHVMRAHRVVMAAASPLLHAQMNDTSRLVLRADPVLFEHVIQLVYCGETIVEKTTCKALRTLLIRFQFDVEKFGQDLDEGESAFEADDCESKQDFIASDTLSESKVGNEMTCLKDKKRSISGKKFVRHKERHFEDRIVEKSAKGELSYLCNLCGKKLKGLTTYRRHQHVHTGARPYKCETCGKAFTQSQRLKVHMRTHTGEKPYLCSLCGRAFSESCKLKRHSERVHKRVVTTEVSKIESVHEGKRCSVVRDDKMVSATRS